MDPILKDISTTIETERLLLRCPQPGEGKHMYEAVNESLDEFQQWFPWAHEEHTLENSEVNVRKAQLNFLRREGLPFMIWLKESKMLVGRVGFVDIDWQIPAFEIGYWLRNSQTGRGYMTEAVAALTGFAFASLDASRVEIQCDARNEKSAAIARRLGYTFEACHRAERFDAHGKTLVDTLVFAKVQRDE